VEQAIELCESNNEKECFVYLEIETDRYIREDEIKQMKQAKKDILEIMPKIVGEDIEDIDIKSFSEKSFEEIFKEFYVKERSVEPQQEVIDLLLSIIGEGDLDNEAN
jgi:exonuclease SbcD